MPSEISTAGQTQEAGKAIPPLVPVCFGRMPDEVLSGFPIYLRSLDGSGEGSFRLYAGAEVEFTAEHRQRLTELGITFVHIPAEHQAAMRRRLEERIERVASDAAIELAARCEIVYEAAVELISETATSPMQAVPRLTRVARAIVKLHQEDNRAFTYLYAAARHDDYGVTHTVNAATWLPALAMALGESKTETLVTLCVGAMLYDVGMTQLPPAILQNKGKLTAIERRQMQQHPESGAQLLAQIPGIDSLAITMALQHQERLDGSGYPRALTFDRIHVAARMAAVIDTFDSLTSFRPYRERMVSPQAALATLRREAPHHYDPKVVEAWAGLIVNACPEARSEIPRETEQSEASLGRRRFKRYSVKCPAVLKKLALVKGIWMEKATLSAVAHNLSRGGLGLLTRTKLQPGTYFRARLQGKDGVGRTLEIMVVRTRDRGDGWCEAGARFVDLAAEASPIPNGEFVSPECAAAESQ